MESHQENLFGSGYAGLGIAILFAIDSLRRIHKVTLNISDFQVEHFYREDRNIFPQPHNYVFSGTIEIRVPTEVAVRNCYLEIPFKEDKKQIKSELLSTGFDTCAI